MNSCSGKVVQRNFEKHSRLIFNDKQADEFEASSVPGSVSFGYCCEGFVILNGKKACTYSQRSSKPAQVGVYIYAHARQHMYENVYKFVDCLYGDTDSVLFARSQMDRIPQASLEKEKVSFSEGVLQGLTVYRKVLGRLDQELRPAMDHAYLLAPKNYCVYGFSDGKPSFDKLKGKGVSFKGISCVYEDGVPLSEDPLRFFKDYVEKGEVIVNCT
jgi:hypothetical protein